MDRRILIILQHIVLDILLPTSDLSGDVNFAISAFASENYGIGCLMVFPVLLNMIFNSYKWVSTDYDSKKEKRFTWILVVLSLWPQYQVVKLLLVIFRGKSRDVWQPMQNKIKWELSYIEPFFEAIPQFFMSMCVFGLLAGKSYLKFCSITDEDHTLSDYNINECINKQFNNTNPTNMDLFTSIGGFSSNDTEITKVFGRTTLGISNNIMFPLSILISSLSGMKSVIDYLLNGPLKITSTTKYGKVSVLFTLIFIVISSFYSKFLVSMRLAFQFAVFHGISATLVIFFILIAFPALIAVCPLVRVVGIRKYARMILSHPELLVLPFITDYVLGPIDGGNHYRSHCHCCNYWRFCTWSCCCKGCEIVHTNKAVISKEMSWTKVLYMTVIWFYFAIYNLDYFMSHSVTLSNYGIFDLVYLYIGYPLYVLWFGITLHCGESKGVIVIENIGDMNGETHEEPDIELQKRATLQIAPLHFDTSDATNFVGSHEGEYVCKWILEEVVNNVEPNKLALETSQIDQEIPKTNNEDKRLAGEKGIYEKVHGR